VSSWRAISAKRISICEVCSREIPKGEPVYWDRTRSVVRCVEDKPISQDVQAGEIVGTAGASARRKYKSKANWNEDAILAKFPRIGKYLNLLNDDPQSTMAWKQGAVGEEGIGEILAELAHKKGWVLLNDRRIRGNKANIDHILVTDLAIFVIDAKNYTGVVKVEFESLLSKKEILKVGGRNQTKLALGMQKQVERVKEGLVQGGYDTAVVQGALAFFEADWPLFGAPTQILDVRINGRMGIAEMIRTFPKLVNIDIERAANILIEAFPAA